MLIGRAMLDGREWWKKCVEMRIETENESERDGFGEFGCIERGVFME